MKLIAIVLLVVVSLVSLYLVVSVRISWRDRVVTLGVPSVPPNDSVGIYYSCPHGHVWGVVVDFGYRRWIHKLSSGCRK